MLNVYVFNSLKNVRNESKMQASWKIVFMSKFRPPYFIKKKVLFLIYNCLDIGKS